MSILVFCPMASSVVYPKRRSAAGLNDSTMPRSSTVMIPSTAVCRMACVPRLTVVEPHLRLLVDHDELVMLLVPFAFGDMERLQRDL